MTLARGAGTVAPVVTATIRSASKDVRFTEDQLTEEFHLSRTTVREAIRILAHVGVLDVRQGDGTYVLESAPPDESLTQRLRRSAALEVYEVRRVLELETARLAATRRSEADVARMYELLKVRESTRARDDHEAMVDADIELHSVVAAASGNAVLSDLFRTFATVLRSTIADVTRDPDLPDTTSLHRLLVDAIATSDVRGAVAATDQLLEADATALRAALARP
ncbi:MAG: FCD domain-containing protein [bacterium]